jgi:hypothetical protein
VVVEILRLEQFAEDGAEGDGVAGDLRGIGAGAELRAEGSGLLAEHLPCVQRCSGTADGDILIAESLRRDGHADALGSGEFVGDGGEIEGVAAGDVIAGKFQLAIEVYEIGSATVDIARGEGVSVCTEDLNRHESFSLAFVRAKTRGAGVMESCG